MTDDDRPVSGRWFEQLPVGTKVRHVTRRTVTETDNVLFTTMTMNPAAMHLDADYASRTEFGRPLVNSMFTAALVVGLSVPELTLGTIIAQVALSQVDFPHPVFAGDTIRVETEVVEARRSRSRPAAGHQAPCPAGSVCISPVRRSRQTSSSRWLYARCSNSTIPASGLDRDRRAATTSVSTRMVSPAKTGAGNCTSDSASWAMIVPRVSSGTDSPTTSAAVNMLFTSGRPNSLCAAYSASRCIGAGFIVIVVNSTLSVSVTVRRVTCCTVVPIGSCSNQRPETGRPPPVTQATRACAGHRSAPP